MKLNKANHKVAVFSIAALALTASAGVTINNLVLNRGSSNVEHSVFAAEIKSGVTATATLSPQAGDKIGVAPMMTDSASISFTIADPSQFSAGDYIEFSTKNIDITPWNNMDAKINGITVGKVSLVSSKHKQHEQYSDTNTSQQAFDSLRPEDSGTDKTYRITFNEEFSKFEKNAAVSLEAFNFWHGQAKANREREITSSIIFDGKTIASSTYTARSDEFRKDTVETYRGNLYSNALEDGETIQVTGMNIWISDRGSDSIRVGDKVRWEIEEGSGLAFNNDSLKGETLTVCNQDAPSKTNQYGTYWYDKTDCIDVRVTEASPTVMEFEVLTAPKNAEFSGALLGSKFKLLDTSSKTIDYANKKIAPQAYTEIYTRANGDIVENQKTTFSGDITGAALKAQGEIIPRGSVIRRIRTAGGNVIEGFESDTTVVEREKTGTAYNVDAPEIPNYTFVGVAEDSAAQNGSIIEGVQTVTLVYKITAQDIEINIGDTPDPKDHIPDFDEKFPGCEVRYKEELDTSKAGTIDATIIISCPDNEDEEVDVKVIVKPAPEVEETPAPQPEAPKAEPKKEIEAPHTGFEKARNAALATFAGLSTFAVISTAIFKRRG